MQACSSMIIPCNISSKFWRCHEQIIFIYSICDDLLISFGISNDAQCKMNSAEVMTVAIVAALFFGGNFSKARLMLKSHKYIQNMLSESRLNRRMHEIDIAIWQNIFHVIARSFSAREENLEYLVDSMPVEVCMNVRSYRCRLLSGKQFIGFCKAKKKFYYGFKLHMITNSKGKPIEFIITPASVADITALKIMEMDLAPGSVVYGDKAYTDYVLEDYLAEIEMIELIPDRKANLKRQHSGCIRYLQSILRKRIETTFSQLVSLFPRKIHAVTKDGFLLKLIVFVVSFSLKQLL
jgi:IS5 family transposase